jgi:hypothetical protein
MMFAIVALTMLAIFRPTLPRPTILGSAAVRTSKVWRSVVAAPMARVWRRSVAVAGRVTAFATSLLGG